MVSDVLFEAAKGLRHYLNSPTYRTMYQGPVRERIQSLLVEMEVLRTDLDTPPKEK